MDEFRYWLAVFILTVCPSSLLFWLIVHPFIHTWRRMGSTAAYLIAGGAVTVFSVAINLNRDIFLAVDWGYDPILAWAGVAVFVFCLFIAVPRFFQFPLRTLAGVPELSPSDPSSVLIRHGVYRLCRHPRYLEFCVGLTGMAMFANYPAVYACTVLCWALAWAVIVVEERELVDRLGDDYRVYQADTPRFMPKWSELKWENFRLSRR